MSWEKNKLESELDRMRWEVRELNSAIQKMRTAGLCGDWELRKVIDERIREKLVEYLMGAVVFLTAVLCLVVVLKD